MINIQINTFLAVIILLLVLLVGVSAIVFYDGMNKYQKENEALICRLVECNKRLTELETVANQLDATVLSMRESMREQALTPVTRVTEEWLLR